MHLAIDASNIRQGGGVTHLSQLLSAASPADVGITHVTVWACAATATQLPAHAWLTKLSPAWTEAGLFKRMLGQQLLLGREMARRGCDVLFSPGGTVPFHAEVPVVTMSQNLLPFEPAEAARFGRWSAMRFKMGLLRLVQSRSFRAADGVIFLTRYASDTVNRWLGEAKGMQILIPHGIEQRFSSLPKRHSSLSEFPPGKTYTFLYVSILMPYKHQIEVAHAVYTLRRSGYPVKIRFVGAGWGWYGQRFREVLRQLDPRGEFLLWAGEVPFTQLHAVYESADAFVFASSCENLPNILIEAMAAALPIACSDRGPMPEVLGDAGVYFNPEKPDSIAAALRALFEKTPLREQLAGAAKNRSQAYSWRRCARETFDFIAAVAAQRGAERTSRK